MFDALRRWLPSPFVGPEDEVLVANQAFYDAHEAEDLDAMAAVWGDGEVVCTHPGWPILRGREEVLGSWRRIFGGPGQNQFILTNVSVVVADDTAWVTCDENLVAAGGTGTVAATNVFRKLDGTWRLVLHHGSPVLG